MAREIVSGPGTFWGLGLASVFSLDCPKGHGTVTLAVPPAA